MGEGCAIGLVTGRAPARRDGVRQVRRSVGPPAGESVRIAVATVDGCRVLARATATTAKPKSTIRHGHGGRLAAIGADQRTAGLAHAPQVGAEDVSEV